MLNRVDPTPSPTLQAVDAKGQDFGTYYLAAFSDTRDLQQSLLAYRFVRDLVRIIILMDRFYEVGNERYRKLGEAIIQRLGKENDENLKHSLSFSLKQFWPFWKFEQYTKKQMIHGHNFSFEEIRSYNLFKSSDAALIYAPLLERILPSFGRNASLIIHYNQALQDIEDDLDDIHEDLRDQMPNVFVLATLEKNATAGTFPKLYKHRLNGSKSVIVDSAIDTVLRLVDEHTRSISGIQVPEQFEFLKYLSRRYAAAIRRKLAMTRLRT
ncbi:MAG TPA: hypothetical protein VLA68_01995 [Nitrososphaera sp.]|nr:hypothetical protein [Nitrososphaera sp.]